MKNTVSLLILALFSITTITAQVQKDVQKKTTIKKVRITDNDKVTTKVVEDVKANVDVIEVEGNDLKEQSKKVITKNADETNLVSDENVENTKNKMMVAEKKKAQAMELNASKKAQEEQAMKEKAALEQKRKEMMEEMEARRAALTKRPKGMAKLQKNKKKKKDQ